MESSFDNKAPSKPKPFAIHLEKEPHFQDDDSEQEVFKYPQMAQMSFEERAIFEEKIAATQLAII